VIYTLTGPLPSASYRKAIWSLFECLFGLFA